MKPEATAPERLVAEGFVAERFTPFQKFRPPARSRAQAARHAGSALFAPHRALPDQDHQDLPRAPSCRVARCRCMQRPGTETSGPRQRPPACDESSERARPVGHTCACTFHGKSSRVGAAPRRLDAPGAGYPKTPPRSDRSFTLTLLQSQSWLSLFERTSENDVMSVHSSRKMARFVVEQPRRRRAVVTLTGAAPFCTGVAPIERLTFVRGVRRVRLTTGDEFSSRGRTEKLNGGHYARRKIVVIEGRAARNTASSLHRGHMITEEHKDHIRRSWKLVIPIADTAADLFYAGSSSSSRSTRPVPRGHAPGRKTNSCACSPSSSRRSTIPSPPGVKTCPKPKI